MDSVATLSGLGIVFVLLAAAATFHIFRWMIRFLIHSFATILKFIIIGFLIGVGTMIFLANKNKTTEQPINEKAKYSVTQSERYDG